MINFDINGATVEFDEKMVKYNAIRKLFSKYGEDSQINFENICLDNIASLKQLSDKGLDIGEKIIDDIIKKSIECIVSYGVITVDFEIFKDNYCNKYLNFRRLFNNLNKEIIIPYKNKKNSSKPQELKQIIKRISEFIYADCFDIHIAVIDVLLDNGVSSVSSILKDKDIKKSNALFNNYRDGFITKPDECRVVEQIISLNPYREDVYEFLVKEDGDFNREVERLAEYLGYDIRPYKATLMDIYIKELIEKQSDDIEVAKEKLMKYSRYIGCQDSEVYITRLESIYSFESA